MVYKLNKEQLGIIERIDKSAERFDKNIERSIKGPSKEELDHLITMIIDSSIEGRMIFTPPLNERKIVL